MCCCASPSLTLSFVCISVSCLPVSRQCQWCVCVSVCLSPGDVTDRVLQKSDLVSPSGLHCANGVCQSTSWQLLVPPTVSVYPGTSENYVLMEWSLKSAPAGAVCRIEYWTKCHTGSLWILPSLKLCMCMEGKSQESQQAESLFKNIHL